MVLLGEVHDNAEQHRLRLGVLERALARGWRPTLAMEQFDREHQPEIERARREAPLDAQHLIDLAAPEPGWNWDFYRPVVALALRYDLPLIAANLSRADAKRIAHGGFGAVFDDEALEALGLDQPIPSEWQAAQEREIDAGHCHALPRESWAALARVQFARDAVMASLLREHAAQGVVLLAGDGHVRRDLGVPRWLPPALSARSLVVGYVEAGDDPPPGAFDVVVVTPRAEREDPCAAFRKRSGPG